MDPAYMNAQDIMDEIGVGYRRALTIMNEIGKIRVSKPGLIKRSVFVAYMADQVPNTFCNRMDGHRYKPFKRQA